MITDIKPTKGLQGSTAKLMLENNRLGRMLGNTLYITSHPSIEDVTVQVIEDGIVTHCNHAGYKTGTVTIYYNHDTAHHYNNVLICDRDTCQAWSHDGKEWYE